MTILENNNFKPITTDKETFEKTIISNSIKDTKNLGICIGNIIKDGDSILLSGDLGAGKTELVRYIVEGSGNDSFVRSPTFVLINNYSGEKNITHCDFYRIDLGAEVEEIGIEEYYENSTVIIEWPEKIINNLPSDSVIVKILFTENEDQRKIMLYSTGSKSKKFINKIK
ncbi:MAG: tRNA (adenosine(37)-N6)-threonylcarbamoyltransferase complex ATPase subunit type 1 TsaE [SAR202 cluster bacterium]|mgnify:FL=1|nr:tRNA (adenosine(37)-N6)-threonylcarbamoyltransferase complex ATPase subunit type 1 TsaE [SAR202 cluster bacterium]